VRLESVHLTSVAHTWEHAAVPGAAVDTDVDEGLVGT